jgi:hypothetical protein
VIIPFLKMIVIGLVMLVLGAWLLIEWHKSHWSRAPCTCGGKMVWLKGQQKSGSLEAQFECAVCKRREFRGGWDSEFDLPPKRWFGKK